MEITDKDWYQTSLNIDVDLILINKLKTAALEQSRDEQTCWAYEYGELVATVSGYNLYHVVLKSIIYIRYPNAKKSRAHLYSLKDYIRLVAGTKIFEGRILSFLDLLQHFQSSICLKQVKSLSHY